MNRTVWLALMVFCCSAAQAQDAAFMVEACKKYATGQDMKDGLENLKWGQCDGYFSALTSALSLYDGKTAVMGVCLPRGVTQNQLAKMFYKQMEDHPERLHEPAFSVALELFSLTWPCSGFITAEEMLNQLEQEIESRK